MIHARSIVQRKHDTATSPPGTLLALERVGAASVAELESLRTKLGYDGHALPPLRNGIVKYRVSYATVDVHGQPAVASGLLIVPDNAAGAVPVISYQHGTIAGAASAPSRNPKLKETIVCMALFGGCGSFVALPDYLGYGDAAEPHPERFADPSVVSQPGANHRRIMHPYLNATTLASASADMLRAAVTAAARLNLRLSSQLFLAGYSEGGQATMALHRYLESDPELSRRFPVTASFPMAGPYDSLRTAQRVMTCPNPQLGAATTAFGFLARDYKAHLWDRVTDFLRPELAWPAWKTFTLDPQTDVWWTAFVNVQPRAMLTGAVVSGLFDGDRINRDHPFARELLANDTYRGWEKTSTAPIHLYHGDSDDIVPWDINGRDVARTMRDAGFNIDLTLFPGGHPQAVLPAHASALTAIERYRVSDVGAAIALSGAARRRKPIVTTDSTPLA